MAFLILWLILVTIFAAFIGFLAFITPVSSSVERWGGSSTSDTAPFVILGFICVLHGVGVVLIAVFVSIGMAITVISLAVLTWGLFAYFTFGFQLVARACASAICSGVILAATRSRAETASSRWSFSG